jgi:hypothetical protein
MENLNNPVEDKIEAPVADDSHVAEAPVVEETPVVEAPVAEEVAPEPVKEEEAPKAEEPSAIRTNDFGRSTLEQPAVGSVANGAIGVTTAPLAPKPAKKAAAKKPAKEDTVAVHSTKNVTWEGVGKVYRGYNIVTKEAAEQWLTRSHIRIATPEEVAKEFGK